MLIEHEGRRPNVADSAYVAPTAVVCGDVTVGPDSRILFGAVLTAEGGPIEVGERCIVMENAVLRGREGHPVVLGDHVLVGPHAHVNGAQIERDVFLATGASVFPGARVGHGSEVRIGAVVHVNSGLRPGTTVPIGWIAVGSGRCSARWTSRARSSAWNGPRPPWNGSRPATPSASAATAATA
jgi:gamma-carbonic anhydrase